MEHRPITDDELDALLEGRDPIDPARLNACDLSGPLRMLFAASTAGEARMSAPRRSRRRRTRLGASFGLAVCAAAAASLIGFNVFGSGASPLTGLQLPSAEAAVLNRIAAATAGGPSPSDGRWLYLELVSHQSTIQEFGPGLDGPTVSSHVTEREQIWTASAHGPTRIRETFTHFAFGSARSRAVYMSHRAILGPEMAPLPLAPGQTATADAVVHGRLATLSPTNIGNGGDVPLSTLPTAPAQLVRVLGDNALRGFGFATKTVAERAAARVDIADQRALSEWIGLSEILTTSTSASQRAEAYRALSLTRFTRVVGYRRDARGRRGIAISFQTPHSVPATLIVDPDDGDVLEEDGTTLWLARATVSSDTQLPDGSTQALPRHTTDLGRIEAMRDLRFGLSLG